MFFIPLFIDDLLAQHFLVRPKLSHKAFIDQRHAPGGGKIAGCNLTPRQQWDTQGLKTFSSYGLSVERDLAAIVPRQMSGYDWPLSWGKWRTAHHPNPFH